MLREPSEVIIGDKTLEDILNTDQEIHLHDVDLRGVNLHGYDLRKIDLNNVNLEEANLSEANLSQSLIRSSNFRAANLSSAGFKNSNIFGTSFFAAILQYTDFSNSRVIDSELAYANLVRAKLTDVVFHGTKFENANFFRADISGSYFESADLNDADIEKAIGNLLEYRKGKILKEPINGYKKIDGDMIILEIPAGAVVFSINGNICRTNKAKVTDIIADYPNDNTYYDSNAIEYSIDKVINVENFDLIYNAGSTTGIHFFMTREEAEDY